MFICIEFESRLNLAFRTVMNQILDDGHFTVSWRDINYYVTRGMVDQFISNLMGQKTENKQKILDNVQGSVRSGEMSALMGKFVALALEV